MSALRVAVVGAGIGGLATASALSHRGIDVHVYEQARQLGEVGAGVAIGSNSIRLLERLGLEGPLREYGPRWTQWRFNDFDGRVLTEQEMNGRVLGMYRPDLIAMLTDNLPDGAVSTGLRTVGFRQDADVATVEFADGGYAEADLVVAADGIHSALQSYVVEAGDPVFSGSVAYRGTVPANRVPDYPGTVSSMYMGEGKHFLVFTLRGGQLINFVGFVPSDDEMRESWSAPGDPAELAREFADWNPMVRNIASNVDATFRWGLYDREPLPRWSNGRLTLLGDAAHSMLPHMGQGANQSIEDAVALATVLDGAGPNDVGEALTRYEVLRRERSGQVQLNSRNGGLVYDSGDTPDREEKLRGTVADLLWSLDYDVEAEARRLTAAGLL
ncbi:FAD-dependent monooxygenase [Mycolicibacterium hodleri]|uniref:2-polyprenyl-6-methoxyphenol hydroxylase n=1 Tax=Mycolicibacterium hodleri TaxID=49897 RepID=A0A502EJK4_9MYCO|nr:FAD-dependent monooxygenase [Mycolicibacterium hodleri]TPG36690.1 2-polyprenyl-6-methoxyphenol hydroxylase [Mycolicibacterium hodleri]